MAKLSVLIPTYNEEHTILELLRRVKQAPVALDLEIIVVDDGSTDGTRALLKSLPPSTATVILHQRNRGKGAAIRSALTHATGDYVIIQDADLEYDPADYPAMLGPLLDGRADAVYGSRFLGGPHRVLFFWHYFANRLFTMVANVLYNINISDMGTCYKAFTARSIKAFTLRSERFGIEAELTAKVCKASLRLYEVPVSYSGRTYAEGKKITWKDGLSYFWCLLRYRVSN